MKKIVKKLEKLASYLEDCDGVSHKADDLHDIIDAFKIECGMPRSRVVSGLLTARGAKWCVLVNVCPDGMVEVFDHSEVGEEMIPRFHTGDYAREYVDMPMREIVEMVTKKMNERAK